MPITALVFLAIYLGCLFKAFNSKPIWGLWAYLLAFYMHPQSKYWAYAVPDLRWSLIAALLTLLAIFIKKGKDEKIILFDFTETKFFLFFCFFVLIQYFWAINTVIHMEYMIMVFKFLILIILIQNTVKTTGDLKAFILFNAYCCFYIGYLAYTTHIGGRFEGVGGPTFNSSNSLGQHFSVILVFAGYLLLSTHWKKFIWIVFPILVILNTIMLAGSRSVLIALVITGALSILYIPKKYKKKFLSLILLGVVAFAILIGPQLIQRFDGMNQNDAGDMKDRSANSRMVIINAQIEMFKERPFMGHGHKGTLFLSPFYIDTKYLTGKKQYSDYGVRASHNFIMAMLVDHGIIGSLPYFLIIIYCLNKLRKLRSIPHSSELSTLLSGLLLGLFCLMVAGLGSNNKVMEIDIWLYALIPLFFEKIKKMEQKNVD